MDNNTTPPWADARTAWFHDYLLEHDHEDCEVVAVINLVGYLPRPDQPQTHLTFDADGHGITAWAMFDFWLEIEAVLRVQIPQGVDPRVIASNAPQDGRHGGPGRPSAVQHGLRRRGPRQP